MGGCTAIGSASQSWHKSKSGQSGCVHYMMAISPVLNNAWQGRKRTLYRVPTMSLLQAKSKNQHHTECQGTKLLTVASSTMHNAFRFTTHLKGSKRQGEQSKGETIMHHIIIRLGHSHKGMEGMLFDSDCKARRACVKVRAIRALVAITHDPGVA